LKTTCALDVWRLRALYPNCSMQDGFFFFFSGFSSKDNDGQANFAKSWCSKIRIINSQSDNWLVDHFVFLFFQEFYSLRMANRIQHSGVQWGILYVLLKFYLLIKVFARDFFFFWLIKFISRPSNCWNWLYQSLYLSFGLGNPHTKFQFIISCALSVQLIFILCWQCVHI
jgi:hypothetical protein